MEMHQIRYFLAAASTLSFTRAAEICHVSQPALTTAIKKLEAQLGTPLFHRDRRRLALTELGRQLQPHLAQIIDQAAMVEGVAQNLRLLNQVPIRLGIMRTIGPVRLARFLAGFEQRHPGVEVAVREGDARALAGLLDADEIDVAILNPMDGLGDSYRVHPLYSERYVVLLPPEHRLQRQDAIALQDLSEEAYVDRLACEMREMVMAVCEQRGVRLYARFRSEREDWVQAMVVANIGFAFMPEFSITASDTVRRPLTDPAVERTISLVSVPGRKHSPVVATFVRAVQAHRWAG